jgi:hypothetical protein
VGLFTKAVVRILFSEEIKPRTLEALTKLEGMTFHAAYAPRLMKEPANSGMSAELRNKEPLSTYAPTTL